MPNNPNPPDDHTFPPESDIERAKRLLFDEVKVTNFGFTRGTDPNATPEQVAGAIADVMEKLKRGEYTVLYPHENDEEIIDFDDERSANKTRKA